MKKLLLIFTFFVFVISRNQVFSQKHLSPNLVGTSNWKITAYGLYKGGYGISFGYAYWIERNGRFPVSISQVGINSSINFILGRSNIANKNRIGSRMQIATVVSPVATFRVNKKLGFYEDQNLFYFGNANALQSRYKNTISFGTNIVLSPKTNTSPLNASINEQNLYSTKNRFQQLVYIGLRFGGDQNKKYPFLFKFNFYEDFIVFRNLLPFLFQSFADHNDRFFTGGGNLEVKQYFKNSLPIGLNLYGDVYTGSFERDMFDYPDIYDLQEEKFGGNSSQKRRNARYVAQEPSQKLLNVGRFFGFLDVPLSKQLYAPSVQLMYGKQGGPSGMGLQDAIHDLSPIDKINPNQDPDGLHVMSGKDKKSFERLHHFYPLVKERHTISGIGIKFLQ